MSETLARIEAFLRRARQGGGHARDRGDSGALCGPESAHGRVPDPRMPGTHSSYSSQGRELSLDDGVWPARSSCYLVWSGS